MADKDRGEWTPDRITRLILYSNQGKSSTDIAILFNMTKHQIEGKIRRMVKAGRMVRGKYVGAQGGDKKPVKQPGYNPNRIHNPGPTPKPRVSKKKDESGKIKPGAKITLPTLPSLQGFYFDEEN